MMITGVEVVESIEEIKCAGKNIIKLNLKKSMCDLPLLRRKDSMYMKREYSLPSSMLINLLIYHV